MFCEVTGFACSREWELGPLTYWEGVRWTLSRPSLSILSEIRKYKSSRKVSGPAKPSSWLKPDEPSGSASVTKQKKGSQLRYRKLRPCRLTSWELALPIRGCEIKVGLQSGYRTQGPALQERNHGPRVPNIPPAITIAKGLSGES